MQTMTTSRRTSVIVVGAGPTGLTLANLLGQSDISAVVIERNHGTVNEPRAVSIDDESLRTMQAIGLDDAVLADVVAGYGVHYYTRPGGHCFGRVEPSSAVYGFPKRNAFRQPLFEATLLRGLGRFASVEVLFGHKLLCIEQTDEGVSATIQREDGSILTIDAQYLVGCDGGRSPVRNLIGSTLQGSSFESRWLVVDTDSDDDTFWQTRVYCDARRPVVEVPGPHRTRRFEFLLHAHESDEATLKSERLTELLRPFRGEKPTSIVRKTIYTFHARVADKWRRGRVFLAGDAAHLTPPYAGQGMNSGVRDAHNLGWKLAAVIGQGLPPSLLDSYELERRDHAWALIRLAMNLGLVMAPKTVMRARVIAAVFTAIGFIPPLRDYFLQMRFKPKPRYLTGLVLPDELGKSSIVGQMLPQPRVRANDTVRPFDDLIGPGFSIVQFGGEPRRGIMTLTSPLWQRLAATRVRVEPADFGAVGQAYQGRCVLLRPDRYVAGSFDPDDEQAFASALEALMANRDCSPPGPASSSREQLATRKS